MLLPPLLGLSTPTTLAFGVHGYEWIIVGALGLLIFGKRLPGAARGIGQSILEFKKGMSSKAKDEDEEPAAEIEQAKPAAKPRFDPQTGKPLDQDHAAV